MYNTLFDPAKLNVFELMNHNALSPGNYDLMRRMEACTIEAGEFDHSAHVQLTWTYLRLYAPKIALDKCSQTIRQFAQSVGADSKYHATITLANFLAVASSMDETENSESWAAFARRNIELLRHPMNIVYRLYSHERLHSDEARDQFLAPDGAHPF